jgi:tetratricopeptide (TPR) repeat protein
MGISVGEMLILHRGYTAEIINERNKVQHNYELLVKALEERPNEAYFCMQLGLELRRMDRLADSFGAYAKALKLAETQPEQIITDEVRETLLTQYSGYLLADQQYKKVLEVLTSDLALRQPLTAAQLLVRGRVLIHIRQPQYALKDVQEAYSRRKEATLFPSAIEPDGTATEALLVEVLYLNQRFEEAITYFEKIIHKSSTELRSVLAYTECLDVSGRTSEAVEFLHQKALGWKNLPDIWIHGVSLLLRRDELKTVAEEWITEVKLYHPDNPHFKEFGSLEYSV